MKTNHILSIICAAGLAACSNMETHSGPFANEAALHQLGDTMHRANAYERQGYSPGDAWETARYDNFGGPLSPFGSSMVPLAGWEWGTSTRTSR